MAGAKLSYISELKRRAKESHVYRKYQLLGLAVAKALGDEKHKSLYMKLAKEHGGERLLALAKDVAERSGVKNRGAYFMSLIAREFPKPPKSPEAPRKRTAQSKRTNRTKNNNGK